MLHFDPPKITQRVKIDVGSLNYEANALADRLGELLTNYTKISLVSFSKIATGGTLRGIHWTALGNRNAALFGVAAHGMFRRQVVGPKSLFWIMSGRRAGAKMPVRLVGTGPRGGKVFEPLPAMLRWFTALNIPRSAWWPIMMSIKRRGIKPTPVAQRAVKLAGPAIKAEAQAARARIVRGIIRRDAA